MLWRSESNAFGTLKAMLFKLESNALEKWKRSGREKSLFHRLNHLYTKAFPKKRWKWKRKRLKIYIDKPKRTHGSFSVTLRNRSECGLFHGTEGEVMVSDGFADGFAGEGDGLLQLDVG